METKPKLVLITVGVLAIYILVLLFWK